MCWGYILILCLTFRWHRSFTLKYNLYFSRSLNQLCTFMDPLCLYLVHGYIYWHHWFTFHISLIQSSCFTKLNKKLPFYSDITVSTLLPQLSLWKRKCQYMYMRYAHSLVCFFCTECFFPHIVRFMGACVNRSENHQNSVTKHLQMWHNLICCLLTEKQIWVIETVL